MAPLLGPFDPVVQLKAGQVDLHGLGCRIGHLGQLLHGQAGIGPDELPDPIRRRCGVVGHLAQQFTTGEEVTIARPDLGSDEAVALKDAEMVEQGRS